jgi:ubiquitin-protein ligase
MPPSQDSNNNKNNKNPLVDCTSLQRSLKRIRLSLSPGELCLQRDLASLTWERVSEDRWTLPACVLERVDPLLLQLSSRTQSCSISIPRLYPHRPPVITRVNGLYYTSIAIKENVHENAVYTNERAAVITDWSPLWRLENVLSACLAVLRREPPVVGEAINNEMTMYSDAPDAAAGNPQSYESRDMQVDTNQPETWLPPNRFDWGYERLQPMYIDAESTVE